MQTKDPGQLTAVHRFLNFDINKDQELQKIADVVSEIFNAPMVLIIIADEVKYSKFNPGFKLHQEVLKEVKYHIALNQPHITVIADTVHDTISADPPVVLNSPYIRSFAGAPLITHDAHFLGSICILDVIARSLTVSQQSLLGVLAKQIVQTIELELSLKALTKQFLEARDAEVKLKSFFETSGACHLMIGRKFEILAFNKRMYDFIEQAHAVKLYPGIRVFQILRPQYLENFINDYQQALKGKPTSYEREVEYLNGQTIWWHVNFEPSYNLEGEIIGISYNATDITNFKSYERRVLEQSQSLEKIAHIQSHELRKPVASILGLIGLFKSNSYKTSAEDLLMLEKAARELDTKIRTIVDFTA